MRLPNRIRPNIKDVLNLKHAHEVLNPDGSIKCEGDHVDHSPVYWVRNNDGSVEKRVHKPIHGSPAVGATPTVIEPPLPSDIGNLIDVSKNILFSSGSDQVRSAGVHQWSFADCWFLVVLCSVAIERPNLRPAIISPDPANPGKYLVNMYDFNKNAYQIRVDKSVGDRGCRPSPLTGEVWACLVERAEAFFRTYNNNNKNSLNTFDSTGWGFPGEAMYELGFGYLSLSVFQPNLFTAMKSAVATKQIISACTNGSTDGSVIAAHCYAVYDVRDDNSLVLVNPWGVDGVGSDGSDDGYVVVSQNQFLNNFSSVVVSNSMPAAPVIPGDLNGDGVVDSLDLTADQQEILRLKSIIAKAQSLLSA